MQSPAERIGDFIEARIGNSKAHWVSQGQAYTPNLIGVDSLVSKGGMVNKELENAFHLEMISVYERAKKECRYTATRFLQMVTEHGGLATAKMLLAAPRISEGLTHLWEAKRLDISMEATIQREPWCQLFTPDELSVARKRLGDLGYHGQ